MKMSLPITIFLFIYVIISTILASSGLDKAGDLYYVSGLTGYEVQQWSQLI